MRMLARISAGFVCLVLAASQGFSQDRPAAGHGAFFVDNLGALNFFLVDFEGDFLRAIFAGNAGDFAREAPDGRRYMHAETAEAQIFVELTSGERFNGSGRFQLSMFVECPVFEPLIPVFTCFFPGPGSALLDARGPVSSETTGEPFIMSAHLAAFWIEQPQAGGPALYIANLLQDDIKVSPAPPSSAP